MPAKMPPDVLGIQHQVRENAMDLQDWMSDFKKWEEDIKKRDTGLLKGDLNPTRGKPVPAVRKKGFAEMIPSGVKGPKDEERERAKKGEEGGERIKPKTYQDYNQWDKFVHKNLDQMLTDFDETDRQEQEEKHRLKLAEERKAIEAKEEAVRQAGLRAEALKEAGNELLRQGDAEGAARKYEESIGAMPHNPIAHANKAQALLKLAQPEEAAAACSAALDQDPRYVKALLRRATALLALPDPQRAAAEQDLRRALLLEPHNKQAKSQLAAVVAPVLSEEAAAAAAAAGQAEAKAEQRRQAQAERERRRRAMPGTRLQVKEVQASEEEAKREGGGEGRRKVEVVGEEEHAPAAPPPPPPPAARGGGGGGGVGGEEEARAVAAAAKAAVQARLAQQPLTAITCPRTCGELHRRWRRVRGCAGELSALLSALRPAELPALLNGDLEQELLSDLLRWTRHTLLPADPPKALALLSGLVQVRRLKLALRLAAPEDRASLREAAHHLHATAAPGPPADKLLAHVQELLSA